jgi:plastocyanin
MRGHVPSNHSISAVRSALVSLTLAVFATAALGVEDSEGQPNQKPIDKPNVPKGPRIVKRAMRDGLRFEPPRFSAAPGEDILVEIENADSTHQTHNFLVVKPGKRNDVVQQALGLGEKGPAQSFVPNDSNVLIHTELVQAEASTKVRFRMPSEKGVYPYVCTFPGHGMVMYGAIYSGVPEPPLAVDPNIPPTTMQAMIAGNGRRPFVQRIFMPNSGPASIAVALPDDQNFCWDTDQCRLRYAWKGTCVDAFDHWKGSGNELAKLPTAPWWRAPKNDFPLRIGVAAEEAPAVKFLGYRLDRGIPEFHYRVDDVEVFEKIISAEQSDGLVIRFRIPDVATPVFYRGIPDGTVDWKKLTPAQAANFSLTLAPSK